MIHPTAIVSPEARVDPSAVIGPWCLVEGAVEIGARTELKRGVTVYGPCRIGADNVFGSHTVLGGEPEDPAYAGEPSDLVIGDRNRVFESVVISRGSGRGRRQTRIGDDNFLMSFMHASHDVQIGHHVRVTAYVALGGHCVLEDHAVISGAVAVGQFVRVGSHAFVTAGATLIRDVLPCSIAHGTDGPLHLGGANLVGLKRHGFSRDDIQLARHLLALWADPALSQAEVLRRTQAEAGQHPIGARLLAFVERSECGILR